jgi:hypothetical protein
MSELMVHDGTYKRFMKSHCCEQRLRYDVSRDAYFCVKCGSPYDVLSVETDHVLFKGMTCISCGSRNQPCCGH